MEYELKLIEEKDFVDYFIIIEDLVSFAKTKMLVGPARGSSCGSLVCYLLGITTIDPIKYDLIFERFIDVNRQDLPDIDIDFSDHHRHLVFEYMVKKYGVNRVAKLGTVSMFQPRSALKEVCKSLDIPPWEPETALEDLIEYHVGDSKAKSQLEDTLKTTDKG